MGLVISHIQSITMDILTIPTDVAICIFLRADGKSLLESMSVCRFFAQVITKIISEAQHDDMHRYLFRIKNITIEILKKYLQCANNEENLANLILAAYLFQNYEIIDEIIYNRITLVNQSNNKQSYFSQGIFGVPLDLLINNAIYNTMCIRYIRIIMKFTEVTLNSQEIEFDDLWNISDYLDTWFRTIMNADQINVLDKMYLCSQNGLCSTLAGAAIDKCYIMSYMHELCLEKIMNDPITIALIHKAFAKKIEN